MDKLSIFRGEAKTWKCQVTNNGIPVNITGWTIYFAVWKGYPASSVTSDAGAIIKKTSLVAGQITITDPSTGWFEINAVKADTYAVDEKSFSFGVEGVPSGASDPVVLKQGAFEIISDVVRAV